MSKINYHICNKPYKFVLILLFIILPVFSFSNLSKKHNKEGVVYWHGDGVQKTVALTFDDGPNDQYTRQILDILKQNDVKATFFMIGMNVAKYPVIAKEVADAGQTIGNHSYSHPNLIFDLNPTVRKQITKTQDIIFESTGIVPFLFRPPYGGNDAFTLTQTKKLGYVVVKWSVNSKDWERPGVDRIVANVVSNIKNGSIILMHDGESSHSHFDRSQTVAALPIIIAELRKQGYEFVTVPELLGLNK